MVLPFSPLLYDYDTEIKSFGILRGGGVPKRVDLEMIRGEFPPLQPPLHMILTALHDPKASILEIADAICNEPATATRILSAANSPYYRRRAPVNSIKCALSRIGLDQARSLVFAVVLGPCLNTRLCPAFDPLRYWKSSILLALTAKEMGPFISDDPNVIESAYVAGIAARLGVLVLAHHYPAQTNRAITRSLNLDNLTIGDALNNEMRISYDEVGEAVLESWGVPPMISEVPWSSWKEREPEHSDLPLVVRRASRWLRDGLSASSPHLMNFTEADRMLLISKRKKIMDRALVITESMLGEIEGRSNDAA